MSISRILVPLDGSNLAESALPPAVFFAENLGADVTIFHVIEKDAPEEVHSARHLTRPDEAEAYLADVNCRFFSGKKYPEAHVHVNAVRDVAASIVEHAIEGKMDLVIMCAHGGGRLRDRLVGNIAQQVIARGPTPVLFLRPDAPPRPEAAFRIRSILLPLDGMPAHQDHAVAALDLARSCKAAVHLVTVVPTPSTLTGEQAAAARMLPLAAQAVLDQSVAGAKAFLEEFQHRLHGEGMAATAEILRGDPAEELAKLAETRRDDMIVLATHGRAGTAAFWARSTAARVLGIITLPALLIPIHNE